MAGNMTRIKNNQITVGTIDNTRIATGTLVGTNFSNNLTLNSNVTIIGNLSVGGNTSTINSVNTYIQDPLITFNNGYTGSLTNYDIGIIVNRNWASLAGYGAVNTAFVWDENAGAFLAIATTTSGNAITGLTNSGFANVKTGNLTSNSATITTGGITVSVGAITAATGGVQNTPIGSTTASTGAFTTLTATTSTPVTLNATNGNVTTLVVTTGFSTSNAQITGGNISGDFNISSTTGQFTNFSSGNAVITGGSLSGITLNASTLQATNFSSGNAVITGGSVNGTTIGATSASTGAFTQLAGAYVNATTGFATANAVITGGSMTGMTSGTYTTLQATNFSSGNTQITGGNITGLTNLSSTTSVATNFSSGNARITGGYSDSHPIGANTAATGAFTTLSASGDTAVTSSTQSTSTSTGALKVTGGVGIGGNLNVGGWSTLGGNVTIGGNLTVAGQSVSIGATTLSINDPIINLNTPTDLSPLTSATTSDIGLKFHYYDTADSAAFVGRANDTGFLEWYSRGSDVGNVFTSGTYGTIKAGEFVSANTTPSTSTATGAIRTSGGLGVAGNVYALGINATNGNVITLVATNFSSGNITGTFYGTIAGTGATANVSLYENVQTTSSASTFYPAFYNATTGNLASYTNSSLNFTPSTGYLYATGASIATVISTNINSTSIVATNGLSTANAVITGGSLNGTTIGATSASTGAFTQLAGQYVNATTGFATANAVITGGSVNGTPIGATTAAAGTFTTLVTSGTSIHAGNLVANATTATTSVTTGALVVAGGAGFGANVLINTGANVNVSRAVGADFYVAGANDTTVLWAHSGASYDSVTVGGAGNTASLATGAKFIVNSNDSMLVPRGDNSGRPGTPVEGMFRYSYGTHAPEWYNGTAWTGASSQTLSITSQTANGDGSTVAISFANVASTASSIVSINGVVQIPTVSYSAFSSNNTIVFTEAPASGDVVELRTIAPVSSVTSIQSTSGAFQFQAIDGTGAAIYTGTSGGNSRATTIFTATGAQASLVANVSVSSANTPTTIDTIDNTQYRSAKYVVQVTNGANYQVSEALVISNGTTATVAEYGSVRTAGNLGVLSATQSGSNTQLQFIAANASTTVRVYPVYLAI